VAGSFRDAPPVLPPGRLTRPRLLRPLVGRFARRLTVVVAGAGHGKTTLLAQAISENRLAPRGEDVWLGLDEGDGDAERLARALLVALGAGGAAPTVGAVCDAVWRRAPADVCVMLDDAHDLPDGSAGQALVADLVDELPANGHVLLAGRAPPPLRWARLAAHGAVLRLGERDLLFDDAEAAEFARERGIDAAVLVRTGGWPAMAELVATAGADVTEDFLWQEVLEPLAPATRRMLAVLCDVGGGDDALLSAALAEAVAFDPSVPLVGVDEHGWYAPHPLWRSVAAVRLADPDRQEVRRRAAAHLVGRGRHEDAFDLLARAELWDEVGSLLRVACRAGARPRASALRDWLARCPAVVHETPAGRLAAGVLTALDAPELAREPLRAAAEGFRAAGDVDGEMSALTHLGHVAWWQRDATMLVELGPRVAELEALGSVAAKGLSALGRALVYNIAGDARAVLGALSEIPPGSLDRTWTAVIRWLRAGALAGIGDDAGGLAELEAARSDADPAFRVTVEAALTIGRWASGKLADVPAEAEAILAMSESAGIAQDTGAIAAGCARACAQVGELDAARSYLARAHAVAAHLTAAPRVHIVVAEAIVAVAEGDEERAVKTLRAGLADFPIDDRRVRGAWSNDVASTYILLPELRPVWDAESGPPRLVLARALAAAVAAGRGAAVEDPIASVPVGDVGLVQAVLCVPFAVELAARLHEAGRHDDATNLLEALPERARGDLRRIGTPAARALLAAVPAAPERPVELCAFGTLTVDGRTVERARVQELLGYLLLHPVATRAAVRSALWPDLDDRAGANNLRVTLTHLLNVLEPGRGEGEASFFVRQAGSELRLARDRNLVVDVDRFDSLAAEAAAAERSGAPSRALEAYVAATDLYRGDLLADLPDAAWAELERDRCRVAFVGAAVRAGELLVAAGETGAAEDLARRALEVDEWAEPAFGVLAAAALVRGDRGAALRALDRCDAMLRDLGVPPSDSTRRLVRRARAAPDG